MDDRSGSRPAEPRQRWRIVFARSAPVSPERGDGTAAWQATIASAGLPLALSQGRTARPRVAVATALPVGIPGEGELAEMVLTERLTRVDVRSRLEGRLATGHRLVDLFDVWLGDPSLAASLVAADYRLEVEGVSAVELAEACRALLDSTTLERSRAKGEGRSVTYDLRPLLLGLEVLPGTAKLVGADGMAVVRMRLRHRQEGGIGRPDEVILALAERLGGEVAVLSTIRERLLTSDELPPV